MEALKPCPFCRCEAKTTVSAADIFFIECGVREKINYATPCVHMSSVNTPDAIERLIKRWNTRPIEESLLSTINDISIELIPMGEEEEIIATLRSRIAQLEAVAEAANEVVYEKVDINPMYDFDELREALQDAGYRGE